MASTAGVAPATSTFARWRSDLTELRGQLALGHLASVIGLAPIRPDLKGRLREWWPCANTFAFTDVRNGLMEVEDRGVMAFNAPTLQSSNAPFILLAPEVGIAPTSPRLQRGANLPQLLGVLAHGQNWSSRQVTHLRLPVISRVLCF